MHKIQTRLFACYTLGRARRILLPMRACHIAGNEYLSQEGPLDDPSVFYKNNGTYLDLTRAVRIINYAFSN